MSALPFFSALPPAQSGASLEKAVNATQPPSSLASNATGEESLAPNTMSEMHSQGEGGEEASQSFWDTLQQQAASSDPAAGQLVSALNSNLQEADDGSMLDSMSVEEVQVEEIHIQGIDQVDMVEVAALSPWSMTAMQSAGLNQESTDNNPAMDQILTQRAAQPQVQQQAGILSQNELQLKTSLDTPITQPLMTTTLTEEVAKTTQPLAGQVMQSMTPESLSKSMLGKETTGTQSGIKLTEGLMSEAPVNIHEKPITLAGQETVTAPIVNQPIASTQDFSLMEGADGMDPLQSLDNQSLKDSERASKVLNTNNQGADKVLAGQAKIDVPPSSPKFTEQIAQRIGIMATEQLQTARIQLDPPELGSLEIKIRVQQDQVSVAFASGHQVVRDALEAQSPRLREMLEQQGVELTDVNVSDQQQQAAGDGNSEGLSEEGAEGWSEDDMTEETLVTEVKSDSLVDYFA